MSTGTLPQSTMGSVCRRRLQRKHTVAPLFVVMVIASHQYLQVSQTSTTKRIRFLFLIGLEGTGHHLYSELVHQSPSFEKLPAQQMIQLQQSLYHHQNKEQSLWGAHCGKEQTINATIVMMNRVVANLKALDQAVDSTVTIPINGPKYPNTGFGMMSYPSYSSHDRQGNQRFALTKYPTMELLYHACQAAKVTCGHVYLHRDPFQVLTSTTKKRHFHTIPEALHIYTTMLLVIHSQLVTFPNHFIACWDYSFSPPSVLGELLGWQTTNDFHRVTQTLYRPSLTNMSSLQVDKSDPFLQAMYRAHEQVKKLCIA